MDSSQQEDDDAKVGRSNWGEFHNSDRQDDTGKTGQVLLKPTATGDSPQSKTGDQGGAMLPKAAKEKDQSSDSSEPEGEDGEGLTLKQKIIHHISGIRGDVFFKSQQRGEPALTRQEKRDIAGALMNSSPAEFLSRYGKHLERDHLSYFERFRDAYEVNFYLMQLEKGAASRGKEVRNRRYQALQELISEGEYFSMSEMRRRNPLLFNHLVGRYMTAEEKESMNTAQGTCNLSTVLMAHMERDQHSSSRRKEQEAEEMEWNDDSSENEDDVEELDDEERDILREEFISCMHDSFLEGRDKDFEYSTVDDNAHYDDIVQRERDDQDRYFDSD